MEELVLNSFCLPDKGTVLKSVKSIILVEVLF